jgi:hypothetical protein
MADNSLGGILGVPNVGGMLGGSTQSAPIGGGNSDGVMAGIGQVNQGANAIGSALNTINGAIGGSGMGGNFSGSSSDVMPRMMKKGGSVKAYTKGGKINLDACSVSTHTKSEKSSNW